MKKYKRDLKIRLEDRINTDENENIAFKEFNFFIFSFFNLFEF